MLHSRHSENRKVNPAVLTVPCRASMTSVWLGLARLDNGQLRHTGHRSQLLEAMLFNCRAYTGSMGINGLLRPCPGPTEADTWDRAQSLPSWASPQRGNYRVREPTLRGVSIFENQFPSLCFCAVLDKGFSSFLWARMVPQECGHKMHTRVNVTTSHGPGTQQAL